MDCEIEDYRDEIWDAAHERIWSMTDGELIELAKELDDEFCGDADDACTVITDCMDVYELAAAAGVDAERIAEKCAREREEWAEARRQEDMDYAHACLPRYGR